KATVEVDCAAIAGLGLFEPSLRLEKNAKIVMGGHKGRIEAERPAQEVHRGIAVAARMAHAAEQEPGHGPLRRALEQVSQDAFGFIEGVCVEEPSCCGL